jgi:light-regulated signal transduction histidine kinase (bacteriophytochrome)
VKEIKNLQEDKQFLDNTQQSKDDVNPIVSNEVLLKKMERLERKLAREKASRQEAELIMETKSRELYDLNVKLVEINQNLESIVEKRTEELRRNLEHVEIVNTELMDIAYVVSHDVRGSVRQIGGLVSLIETESNANILDKEDLGEYVGEIQSRTFKMYHLLDGIREYISIGREAIDEGELDMHDAVSKIINKLTIPNGFEIQINGQLPTMRLNAGRCEHIFKHILNNAIQYHHQPSKGLIKMDIEKDDNFVKINISDNGPGIAPRYHQKIFKLFQSLDNNKKGKGVGLPVVKKMLEVIGGKINLTSEEGQGATFQILLPIELVVK